MFSSCCICAMLRIFTQSSVARYDVRSRLLRNSLGNFHAVFDDNDVERVHLMLTQCNALVLSMGSGQGCHRTDRKNCESPNKLSNDKDPKTYSDSRSLLNSICDLEFLLHRTMYTKRYLSTTSVLSTYLQGKGVDVIKRKTKRNTYLENAIPRKITN